MFRRRRNCDSCTGWRGPISSNVHIRSNVYISGHRDFSLKVRGRGAIRAYAARHNVELTSLGLTLQQAIELASEIPCSKCKAFPEGVMLENNRPVLCFSCPKDQCERISVRAVREFRVKVALIDRGLTLFRNHLGGRLDPPGLLGLALAETPLRHELVNSNEKHIVVCCKLTSVQEYIYGYLPLPERSSLANAALADLIQRKSRNV